MEQELPTIKALIESVYKKMLECMTDLKETKTTLERLEFDLETTDGQKEYAQTMKEYTDLREVERGLIMETTEVSEKAEQLMKKYVALMEICEVVVTKMRLEKKTMDDICEDAIYKQIKEFI